ncbi:MAG: hypothetical protein IH623_14700 [Verrucomicrobia bacterium]|nr:hypothetical protein [Verrucomicrobiota bacterium]
MKTPCPTSTAGSKYLVRAFCEDDDFDTDQGYRGTNQPWLGIKAPWMVATADRGVAWNTRDEDVPNVFNSVFAAWHQGLKLDADGLYWHTYATPLASIQNNLWDGNAGASSADGKFIFTTPSFNNTVEDALLGPISYENNEVLDPRPQPSSPVFNNVFAGAPMAVNYRGAFSGPSDNWADGWTAISQYGYLKSAVVSSTPNPVILTITPNGANVDISFTSQTGFSYTLESTDTLSPADWGTATGVTPANPQTGTGGMVTFTVPAVDATEFFQVKAD